MDQELKSYLEAMEARLSEHTDAMETRLREHTETVETRLLSEFWKWARSADLKARQHTNNISSIDERLLAVEERLSDLERKRPH
jgi:hypothetical protein